MKTITELQAELRTVTENINAISGELTALQKTKTRQEIDFRHIEIVGSRYAPPTHCMKGQPAKLQRHYFVLLSALLLRECKNPENGWLFVQRLATAAGCPAALADLQADAAGLTAAQMDQATAELIASKQQNALLVDMMLLYLACEGENDGKEYLAMIAELLGSQAEQIEMLAEFSGLIAKEDGARAQNFIQDKSGLKLEPFIQYIG